MNWRKQGLAFLLGFLLISAAWLWGGLRPSCHWVGVVAGVLLLVGLFMPHASVPWHAPLRDPLFYIGLAFLGFLTLQWANAGRIQYFDVGVQRWTYTPPPRPDWPSAFSRQEALQMLTWFMPAWALILAVRSPRLDRHQLQSVFLAVAYSTGVLALLGIGQFLAGAHSMYGVVPVDFSFFATFPYANHAGSYFVLVGALACGLLYRHLFQAEAWRTVGLAARAPRRRGRIVALACVFALCLAAANFSISRAGMALAWTLALFAASYGLWRGWRFLPPVGRVNLIATMVVSGGLLFFAVAGWADQAIAKEFGSVAWASDDAAESMPEKIERVMDGRQAYARAAYAMWLDQPWFGVGGWGYRYLVTDYMEPGRWPVSENNGWANVHHDAAQFLVEFGLIGFGLMNLALLWLIFPAVRPLRQNRALGVMVVVGLVLVTIHSLIDLPFRSPAILYTWLALLAALPKLCARPARLAVDG